MPNVQYNRVFPIVHLNGSGKQILLRDYTMQHRAIRDAIDVLQANPPHMRDYYPYDNANAVFKKAQAAHVLRIAKLEEIKDEFEEIIVYLTKKD